jgi:hypothetical protein
MKSGRLACFGDNAAVRTRVAAILDTAAESAETRKHAVDMLSISFGNAATVRTRLAAILDEAMTNAESKARAVAMLSDALPAVYSPNLQDYIVRSEGNLGLNEGSANAKRLGYLVGWRLLGPIPCGENGGALEEAFTGEPGAHAPEALEVSGKLLSWDECLVQNLAGVVDFVRKYGPYENTIAYAHGQVSLSTQQDILLKIGSSDAFKCWFNGREVGRFDGIQTYVPEENVVKVTGEKGANTILLKSMHRGGPWALSVRVTDAAGSPPNLAE